MTMCYAVNNQVVLINCTVGPLASLGCQHNQIINLPQFLSCIIIMMNPVQMVLLWTPPRMTTQSEEL